jgi:nucleoside-diphosphate-sugar epimerase
VSAEPIAAFYSGKRVLVTGAGGYIGTYVASLLRGVPCTLRAIVPPERVDAHRTVLEAVGPTAVEMVGSDLRAERNFERLVEGCDVVFHLAAQTSHYEANAHPSEDLAINVQPVVRLLEGCRDHGLSPRIVFASSATVVGLPSTLPVTEEATCHPITIYDVHKLCAERYFEHFSRAHGIHSCSLRLANVYGTSAAVTKPHRGVVNQMVKRALAGEDLTVYGSGEWLRDYVHVSDVAAAFLHAGAAPAGAVSGRSFNVCTGTGTRFVDVLSLIAKEAAKISGKTSRIVRVDKTLSAIDERSYIGDISALIRATGWKPKMDLQGGIAELLSVASAAT